MNLGTTTCYKAFTLRLVTFIFSSRVKKDACSDAVWMSTSRMTLNFSLHFWMENPPLSNPIWLIEFSPSSCYFKVRFGISTPAIFSYDLSKRMVDRLTASMTFPLSKKSITGTLLLRIWLRPWGRMPTCTVLPYSFCSRGGSSWLLWIFSWGRLLYAWAVHGLCGRLLFFVCRAACSCIIWRVHAAGCDLLTH